MKNEVALVSEKVAVFAKKLNMKVLKGDDFGLAYSTVVDLINTLTAAKKEADDEIKKVMKDEYLKTGTQTIKTNGLTVTYVPGGVRDAFDTAAFKEANPEVYAKFIKTSATSEFVRIKVNTVKKEGK